MKKKSYDKQENIARRIDIFAYGTSFDDVERHLQSFRDEHPSHFGFFLVPGWRGSEWTFDVEALRKETPKEKAKREATQSKRDIAAARRLLKKYSPAELAKLADQETEQ